MTVFSAALDEYKNLFQKLCTTHWVGVLLALLIGISVLLPQLIWRADDRYQGVDLIGLDAEEHYIARVNDVYKGNVGLGNTFLADKDKSYLQPPLGEILQSGLSRIFFLNVTDGIVLAKFVFPFLIALVVYSIGFVVSGSRMAAVIAVASVILGHLYMSGVSPWLDLIRGVLPIGSYTLYSRPINPQISSLFMFVGILVLYRGFFMRRLPHWWEVGVVGVLTGASLYMSPYTFTFLGGIIAVSTVWFFIKRDYTRAFPMLYAGCIGLMLCVPFFINYMALHADPGFVALAQRQGLVEDHRPVLSVWLIVMLGLSVFLWPKVYAASRTFFIVMVSVLLLLTNQHVLTGMILHPSHYHWYITKPLLGVMLGMYAAFLLNYLFKSQTYMQVGIAGAIVFVLFYTSPLLHSRWYAKNPDPPVLVAQAYAPVLKLLNTIEESKTVWADPGLSSYIAMYTKHNTPNTYTYVVYYLNPQSFYENTLMLEYRLAGETPDTILGVLTKDRSKVSERLFGLYYRQAEGDLAKIPDATLAELAKKYKEVYRKPLKELLSELGVGVIVEHSSQDARYKIFDALHLFASVGSYNLYTVSK